MGKLIRIAGVTFADEYILDTVELPDEPIVPDVPDEPIVPVTIADYPVQDGLKGLYDFGSATENGSLYNHANPSLVPTLDEITADGAKWTEQGSYATFSGSSNKCRINTGIMPDFANTVTYVALFRVVAPNGGVVWRPIIGNRRNTSVGNKGADLRNGVVDYGYGEIDPNLAIFSDKFIILVATASSSGYALYRYTNGSLNELASDTVTINTGITANDAIKIGGNAVGNTSADADISLAAIHEGAMTDEQLEDICQFVYDYGTNTKGLTIE